MTRTATHRSPRFLDSIAPFLGGKRRLLPHIARALPPPTEAPVLIDAFCGSGAVSLWAKRRGYAVRANDVAERSVIVARGLVANDRTKIEREDVLRLFEPEPEREPGFIEATYAGNAIPTRHARFLDTAFAVARRLAEPKRSLMLVLLMRFVIALRPMSNWGARRIIAQLDGRRFDEMNQHFLRDRTVQVVEAHPLDLLEALRLKVNGGIFAGAPCSASQADVFDALAETDAVAAFLDPPYAKTANYECALRPLDNILCGHHVDSEPSVFSGRRGIEALDRLIGACAHIPHVTLTYGNQAIDADAIERLVSRHRHDVHVEVFRLQHLAALASDNKRQRNREIVVRAGRAR